MRSGAAGWAFEDRAAVLRAVQDSALPTHDHPKGNQGGEAVALGVGLARQGLDRGAVLDRIVAHTGSDPGFTPEALRPDCGLDPTCRGSVPPALVALREGASVADVMRRIV